MASNTVNFTINLNGNAYSGVVSLNNAVGQLQRNVENTTNSFNRVSSVISTLNHAYQLTSSLVGKVAGAIGKVVDAGSENELQKMNMTTLFKGNAEAAEDMFARISEYGKVTVYDKAGLLEAQKTMMSFGIEGEKSFATLKQIGDIAMGDKQKMQSLALAFSQATSAGKLQG